MQTENYKERISFILKKAKTKDGLKIPDGKTQDDISAISLYYMLDKDSWQLKVWLYPTNQSKTYNLPIKDKDLKQWVSAIKSINTFDYLDMKEEDKDDEW